MPSRASFSIAQSQQIVAIDTEPRHSDTGGVSFTALPCRVARESRERQGVVDGERIEGDAVIAAVPRGRLSAVLAAVHRGGQGHNARVLDPARGDVRGQLRRAGVQQPIALDPRAKDIVLILIHAPGRIAKTADLLKRAGETEVHIVGRSGATIPHSPAALPPVERGSAGPQSESSSRD